MLRDSDDDAAARAAGRVHLAQDPLVVLDVLDDVERANNVEFITVRNAPGVHLQQRRARNTASRERERRGVRLRALEPQTRRRLANRAEDIAGAAADLEQTLRPGEMCAHCPDNQARARCEPEVLAFKARQHLKARFVVADICGLEGGGKSGKTEDRLWLKSAAGTTPPGCVKAALAAQAALHMRSHLFAVNRELLAHRILFDQS